MEPTAKRRRKIALVLDPRSPGGASASVAEIVRAFARHADLRVYALETTMFKGQSVHPALQNALDAHGKELVWNPPIIRSEIVAFHDPSCLEFDDRLDVRISCPQAFVVTHENFLAPTGSLGFDVAKCLCLIGMALVCRSRFLVPISACNRHTVETWTQRTGSDWHVADFNWPNICNFEMKPPNEVPRDRRGRHSCPGPEKFPPLDVMLAHFPPHAESCAILGADSFLTNPQAVPKHWKALRFRAVDVASFLEDLDFFVYFTHPLWRESSGRVLAEAIAAGKVVITDPGTAETFGDAVVASDGDDVDRIIRAFVEEPRRYREFVRAAQRRLEQFRPESVAQHILSNIERTENMRHVLL